jgi:O-antigen/teichoic acid export membrane protein
MAVITVAMPIAYQSDRLLLSHLSDLGQVAIYAVGAQLYGALFGLVGAAGMSLWPVFARRRAHHPVTRHELVHSWWPSLPSLASSSPSCLWQPDRG